MADWDRDYDRGRRDQAGREHDEDDDRTRQWRSSREDENRDWDTDYDWNIREGRRGMPGWESNPESANWDSEEGDRDNRDWTNRFPYNRSPYGRRDPYDQATYSTRGQHDRDRSQRDRNRGQYPTRGESDREMYGRDTFERARHGSHTYDYNREQPGQHDREQYNRTQRDRSQYTQGEHDSDRWQRDQYGVWQDRQQGDRPRYGRSQYGMGRQDHEQGNRWLYDREQQERDETYNQYRDRNRDRDNEPGRDPRFDRERDRFQGQRDQDIDLWGSGSGDYQRQNREFQRNDESDFDDESNRWIYRGSDLRSGYWQGREIRHRGEQVGDREGNRDRNRDRDRDRERFGEGSRIYGDDQFGEGSRYSRLDREARRDRYAGRTSNRPPGDPGQLTGRLRPGERDNRRQPSSGMRGDYDDEYRGYGTAGMRSDYGRGQGYRPQDHDQDDINYGRGDLGYEREGAFYQDLDEPTNQQVWESWDVPGPFRGRGPADYRRSDESIEEDVCNRLTRHGRIDASEINIEVKEGRVTLRGSVPSRDMKRLAEDVADDVRGVQDIDNEIKVTGQQQRWGSQHDRWGGQRPPEQGDEYRRGEDHLRMKDRNDAADARQQNERWRETGSDTPAGGSTVGAGMSSEGATSMEGLEKVTDMDQKKRSLREGMEVVGKNGKVVGTIKEIRREDFLVDRDMARDVYIPYTSVESVGASALIEVNAEDVDNQGWDKPGLIGG